MKKTIASFAAAAVIGAAAYFTGMVDTVGDALAIATNREAAIEACEDLIEGNIEPAE